jgi:hypothetical protein
MNDMFWKLMIILYWIVLIGIFIGVLVYGDGITTSPCELCEKQGYNCFKMDVDMKRYINNRVLDNITKNKEDNIFSK